MFWESVRFVFHGMDATEKLPSLNEVNNHVDKLLVLEARNEIDDKGMKDSTHDVSLLDNRLDLPLFDEIVFCLWNDF